MCIDFYKKTEEFLKRKAAAYGVTDLEKYYTVTDTKLNWYKSFVGSDIAKCFAQLAFHAQNATIISNIVRFEDNFDFLYKVCCDFNPLAFVEKYCPKSKSFDEQIKAFVEILRFNEASNKGGLIWDSSKSEKKDSIAVRYAKALINGAKYLAKFSSKQSLVDDLLSNKNSGATDQNRKLVKYFMKKIGKGSGFSVALTCDFLKELDTKFDFLAKPDIHIMDVMAKYKRRNDNYYYYGERKAFECLKDFQKLVEDINSKLHKGKEITVYQLDRMIWLICSGDFFLDTKGFSKKDYLKYLLPINKN